MSDNPSGIAPAGNKYRTNSTQQTGVEKLPSGLNPKKLSSDRVIDGFIKARGESVVRYAKDVHQKAQRSSTLVRTAVKRPVAKKTSQEPANKLKARIAGVDTVRLTRAKQTSKNQQVDRFGGSVSGETSSSTALVAQPRLVVAAHASAAPALSSSQAVPSMITSASHHQLERLLDLALARADSHKKALKHHSSGSGFIGFIRRAPRWSSVGVGVLTALLLVGFFAWQNMPQFAVRVAASRAHVSASVPQYTPSGFSFAKVSTIPNESAVTMHFKANTDKSRSFALTEKKARMDSSYITNSLVPKNSSVQTSQVNGTTVYIYGDTNDASWISHGILYTIKNAADLNSDQILKIADGS